jgi:beta-aspartyl-peptidase (threonine type)
VRTALIVHGGAKDVAPELEEAHRAGCLAAVEAGWVALRRGESALDAVEAAIRVMESDPTFNAGKGSTLNRDGEIEMDAALMEGHTARCGAVGAIRGVRHAISVARKVLETDDAILLVGTGAREFADAHDAELCPSNALTPYAPELRKKRTAKTAKEARDTVGAVALDENGTVVCGTSTGGLTNKIAGRVGDSPLIGCGLFASSEVGVALTGDGEEIIRLVLAKYAADLVEQGQQPADAARMAIEHLRQRSRGEAGVIVLDRHGRFGSAHNSSAMPCAFRNSDMDEAAVILRTNEQQYAPA